MAAPAGNQSYGRSAPAASAPHQQTAQAPAQTSGGGGLFGQMASTAAGVAVGSTLGHGLSGMLFGGGGEAQQQQQQQQDAFAQAGQAQTGEFAQQQARVGGTCETQSKDFLRCLDATNNNMESCSFYLEMLKQCQAAAKPY